MFNINVSCLNDTMDLRKKNYSNVDELKQDIYKSFPQYYINATNSTIYYKSKERVDTVLTDLMVIQTNAPEIFGVRVKL
ncbi:unnamed protein product, partial [Didymodactylos carnosus]